MFKSGFPRHYDPTYAHLRRRKHHWHNRRVSAVKTIQKAWRKKRYVQSKPKYSHTKSVRSVNAPNSSVYRGRNMVQNHKYIGNFNNKMLKGLTGTGILEKRLIKHLGVDYDNPALVANANPALRSMSGKIINYSNNDPVAGNVSASTGIPDQLSAQAFVLASGVSRDRYVFLKNFRTEITITTEASTFAGAPDPTEATQLGYVNTLNFRVILLKRKPGTQLKNTGIPLDNEPTLGNSLFLGYDNQPYGFTRQYGEPSTSIVGRATPIDVQFGMLNKGMWQILQDKQFPLSVPVANVAGAESKYPNMKKLVFSHKINEKVLVSTSSIGTFPLDWDSKYMCVILAGLPNSSVATTGGTSPPAIIPQTNRLWKVSTRGFTSYMDA